MSALRGIKPASLRQQVVGALRASILTGEIKPGEIWSAPALAQRLGVSATPVREAMLELASHGIVEPVRNRGFRVVPVTAADLDEIHELRLLVEVPLVGELAGRLDAKADERLQALADRGADAARRGDVAAFADQDRAFHLRLLTHVANERAVELVRELDDPARLSSLRHGSAVVTMRELAADHQAILDAVRSGARAGAEAAMRAHLDRTRATWSGPLEPRAISAS